MERKLICILITAGLFLISVLIFEDYRLFMPCILPSFVIGLIISEIYEKAGNSSKEVEVVQAIQRRTITYADCKTIRCSPTDGDYRDKSYSEND